MTREEYVRGILVSVGEDPTREGLRDTPARVSRMWDELLDGYQKDPAEVLKASFEGEGYSQMVVLKDIEFASVCEHHMLPFVGVAHVAYIPHGRVVGLSKLARLVEVFAHRLQLQERLTNQIAEAMMSELQPVGVAVVIEAHHMCVGVRGVKKPTSRMVTSAIKGAFTEPEVRAEFMSLVQSSNR